MAGSRQWLGRGETVQVRLRNSKPPTFLFISWDAQGELRVERVEGDRRTLILGQHVAKEK